MQPSFHDEAFLALVVLLLTSAGCVFFCCALRRASEAGASEA